jgi:hypothetical protein
MEGFTIFECLLMCLAALLAVFQARLPMSSIMALSYRFVEDMMLLSLLLLLLKRRNFQRTTDLARAADKQSMKRQIALDATEVNCYKVL